MVPKMQKNLKVSWKEEKHDSKSWKWSKKFALMFSSFSYSKDIEVLKLLYKFV